MIPGENRMAELRALNPEKLMVVDVEEIAPLLDIQFGPLKQRGDALLEQALAWVNLRYVAGQGFVIPDDAAMAAAADLYNKLQTFAADNGEVEEARKKVGHAPRLAVGAINAWFGARRDRILGAMGTIGKAQARRLDAVKEERAQEARRAAKLTEDIARAKLAAARAAPSEEAIEAAQEAEDRAEAAKAEAAAPMQDMTRIRSATGVTTSGSETWTYELTDMMALAKAVVAGTVPVNFLAVNDAIVRVSIRDKAKPMRECAGLRIFAETKVNRRGAR
jgi:hypothetical protein